MGFRHALIPGAVMKHLSLCVTVLLLGAVPLTAAALDYGPNRPLLAVANGAPQLPGAQARATPMGAMTKSGGSDADAEEAPDAPPVAPHMTPSTSSPSSGAVRARGPTASNKPASATAQPSKADVESGPATWQSLLPGSIQ
jgi:hypothetical protein